jgi:hypothetical protein
MSTNYKQLIEKTKEELKTAKEAGVREQTLVVIRKRIEKLKRDIKWEKKYRDIKYLREWPGDILIKRYEEATSFTTDREKEIEGIGLFNLQGKEDEVKKFKSSLKLVEKLEDEGRRRDLIYFKTDQELKGLIKEIFGVELEGMTEEEIRMHEQARRKGAIVYRIEAGKVVVLA